MIVRSRIAFSSLYAQMKISTSGTRAAATLFIPALTSAERSIVRLRNNIDRQTASNEAVSASMNGYPTRASAVKSGGGSVCVARHTRYRISRTTDIPVINDRAKRL